ncbi:MAG: restriction endonuclease subunit S [Bacilli bacterium]|nr:restriction endonuclease subunit S [Bacilli bacterium]
MDLESDKGLPLKDLCTFQEGYVNPPQDEPSFFDGNIKWLRAVDINESFIIQTSRTLSDKGFQSAKKSAFLYPPNSIAISKSGTIGRLGIIGDCMCGNRAVIGIMPKDRRFLPLVYSFLKTNQREIELLAVGSVQKNLYVSQLEQLTIPAMKREDLDSFLSYGSSVLSQIENTCREIDELSQTRDVLLPKLMSGEIDVDSIEID